MYRFSPSQIKTFQRCQRKWAIEKVFRLSKDRGSAATEKGTMCHKAWEEYLKHGTAPIDTLKAEYPQLNQRQLRELANVCKATLSLLPLPGICEIEGEFFLDLGEGTLLRGFIDFSIEDQGEHEPEALGVPTETDFEGVPLVGDHKTSSDPDQYGLTAESLPMDPQGIIYSAHMLVKHPEAKAVDLFWSYSATKGKKRAKPLRVRLTRSQVDKAFSEVIVPAVEQMKAIHDAEHDSPLKVVGNAQACSDFGGCPHRDHCTDIGSAEILKGMFQVGLMEKIQAKNKENKAMSAVAGTAEPEVVPPDAPDVPANPVKAKGRPKKAAAKKAAEAKPTTTLAEQLHTALSGAVDDGHYGIAAAIAGLLKELEG